MRKIVAMTAFAASLLPAAAPAADDAGQITTPAGLARIAGWKGSDVNSANAFRFVVMSDRTGGHVPGVWSKAVRDVNRLKPDFVMCIGDLVEGFEKTKAGALAEWKEMDAMIRELEAPFFYCPGNHDVPNAHYRSAWRRRPGAKLEFWYSFDYRGCHFVVFDSTAMEREIPGIAEEQWAWLAKDLAAAKDAKHIFIFEHHPIYHDRGDWMRLRKMLHPGKTTIFSGHEHGLNYTVEHGIPYLVLGATGGFGGDGKWETGGSHQIAHVTVSDGKPRICILPVDHVLPHDLRTRRSLGARRRALTWGAEFADITRAAGELTFELPNASDVKATYTLRWRADAGWFGGKAPAPETVTLPPGRSVRRTYRLAGEPDPLAAPPAVELTCAFAHEGKPAEATRVVAPFARPLLTAARLEGATVDGKLGEWADVKPHPMGARWQVGDNAKAWSGPKDVSGAVRVGYDARSLYVAVDVTDDALVTGTGPSWRRDGVEVFVDPRGGAGRGGPFAAPCRQVAVPLPMEGRPAEAEVGPDGARPALRVRAAARRRPGGYVIEAALPLNAIGGAFKAGPGAVLRMDVLLNDRDDPGEKAPTTCLSTSGYTKCNYRTWRYAELTFK